MISAIAQKPVIDTSIIGKWPELSNGSISDDGNYILYEKEEPASNHYSVVLTSATGGREKEFPQGYHAQFMSAGRMAVFNLTGDSLCVYNIECDTTLYIANVREYKVLEEGQQGKLIYRTTNSNELILLDPGRNRMQTYKDVTDFRLRKDGKVLVMQTTEPKEGGEQQTLQWLDIGKEQMQQIWSGRKSGQYVFNGEGVAFLAEGSAGAIPSAGLWYFAPKKRHATLLVNADSVAQGDSISLARTPLSFSQDGCNIFFRLEEKVQPAPGPGSVMVDVWSYKDGNLQSAQLQDMGPGSFLAVAAIDGGSVLRLQQKGETILEYASRWNDDALLAYTEKANVQEWWWNPDARPTLYEITPVNGDRKVLVKHAVLNSYDHIFSPGGKWLIYYDYDHKAYYSYDRKEGITRNITGMPNGNWQIESIGLSGTPSPGLLGPILSPAGIGAWFKQDRSVLIYDNFDIWKVDPSGSGKPVNITGGMGRKLHIRFRLAEPEDGGRIFSPGDVVLLSAFDETNKNCGFYQLELSAGKLPVKLNMDRWSYLMPPVKARKAHVWLVQRMNATEYPNYWTTRDFKTYTAVSKVTPQKQVNWLTAELVHWKATDGTNLSGILYRPEDFDKHKRYPVILTYYEKRSDELNNFLQPGWTQGAIDIPYFIGRGYLVFVPDIEYRIGKVGWSIMNCVISAARHLSREPWIDKVHMGINGHSFGGYETNYLITHSHLFAAAVEGSGTSDCISGYGGLMYGYGGEGTSRQILYERVSYRMGSTLWQRPDLYIHDSPIFKADQVTTPLLMMHNKKDVLVSFDQGVEFFTALRRLGKRAWMLQYDGSGHIAGRGCVDYTIRVTQFFDHYLKGAPPPTWMTEGIPARLKGIKTGYELDRGGGIP